MQFFHHRGLCISRLFFASIFMMIFNSMLFRCLALRMSSEHSTVSLASRTTKSKAPSRHQRKTTSLDLLPIDQFVIRVQRFFRRLQFIYVERMQDRLID